jgi:hypothetical protein
VEEVMTRVIRGGLPWELHYADDLVLMAESQIKLKHLLQRCKNGLKVYISQKCLEDRVLTLMFVESYSLVEYFAM